MTVLCLTGWQQASDALAVIAPDAVHFDYSAYGDLQALFADLPKQPALAIGWSLGGQLLARAVAQGAVKPRHLLLLGAPFQWVEGQRGEEGGVAKGFPREAVAGVREHYLTDAETMLRNLNALVALGDTRERQIVRSLNAALPVWEKGLFWLDELTRASCRGLDFSGFPPVTIVHGEKDKVIHPTNAHAYAEMLPKAELHLWPECAHAPHLHNVQALRELVAAYV